MSDDSTRGWIPRLIRFCLTNKLIVALLTLVILGWGLMVAPFDWDLPGIPRDPVPVDAIPDIGENQQIVFSEWMGRSPQDVEDQITYPLTVSLLGIPGVKTVRSFSFFGFSTIYVIFEEDVEFYWSRSRVLEKLSSLPAGTLPTGVAPALGPDATALGQVYWYTLEGRDAAGEPTGGWDLDELRTVQDWQVRYALMGADGVSEVASVGGFVREYQVDVDPDAMRAHGVTLTEIVAAVRGSNLDVGARTIEVNAVEYVVRGKGFVRSIDDLDKVVVRVNQNVPIRVQDVARVSLGPALRRGALDKAGAEAVGGVVVVRYGDNPLAALERVKETIDEIAPGLPRKVVIDYERANAEHVTAFAEAHGFTAFSEGALNQQAWTQWAVDNPSAHPQWLTLSQVTVVPFYDRTGLIYETLGTLNTALTEEILISIIVVIALLLHLRSSLLISGLLPLAVLICFIAMKQFGVDANVVALSGIAIAIGTMVDMGIILCENILKHLDDAPPDADRREVIFSASSEVGGAVATAVATTVVSFLPVFAMEAAEGKLFKPLAFTKTFALLGSIVVALTIIPPAAHVLFTRAGRRATWRQFVVPALTGLLALAAAFVSVWLALGLGALAVYQGAQHTLSEGVRRKIGLAASAVAVVVVAVVLSEHWLPLGPDKGSLRNLLFTGGLIGGVLGGFAVFLRAYPVLLAWCLRHKLLFLSVPTGLVLFGAFVWLGFPTLWVPEASRPQGSVVTGFEKTFPGLGKEFMPDLDEGSFLYMPTTMPHASIGEAMDALQKLDMALSSVPEVELVVGKLGRADTPLDPAPISMFETVVNYKPEYLTGRDGQRVRFAFDAEQGDFLRDAQGELIPDPDGLPFRQWRDHIRRPSDIWDELVRVARLPGTTSAPPLQPIAARIVMLQSGMRAPMGIKIKGPDLATIERVGLDFERLLKDVPSVQPAAVIADRIVGKPYLEIEIDREAIARHGLMITQVQEIIQVAVGGRPLTATV
ncbi:efflux RND transporter permease subunit, partial [Planctomycetota bacterium]|nr:efflux RND transporter permease subunit [Planctomycetota bacterium]